MREDEIRRSPPRTIDESQRDQYFEQGYLHLPEFLSAEDLAPLKQATDELLDQSRNADSSDPTYDLGPNHSADSLDVRRIRAAVDQHAAYWAIAADSIVTELAADLVGPNVKFHSAKLNFKRGGNTIRWHQDIQAWPHTNYSPVTVGIYLEDVGEGDGPLQVVPGSHNGPLFDQYPDGRWTGYIAELDLAKVATSQARNLTGSAGTVFALNCRVVHGSPPNDGTGVRPCLLNVYSSADAFTYTSAPTPTSKTGTIVRGSPARWAHVDPRPCRLPPDWALEGYGSIYSAQAGEDRTKLSK